MVTPNKYMNRIYITMFDTSVLTPRNIIIVILALLVIYYLYNKHTQTSVEGYNDQAGKMCTTCNGKTPNQCLSCFNCGWCVDKWGSSGCIGGTHQGPFNFERCAKWTSGDPFAYMMQRNANYGCESGPRSSNRLIGI